MSEEKDFTSKGYAGLSYYDEESGQDIHWWCTRGKSGYHVLNGDFYIEKYGKLSTGGRLQNCCLTPVCKLRSSKKSRNMSVSEGLQLIQEKKDAHSALIDSLEKMSN